MKNLNKKGFTLIELLAVIVILGVLLAIAVPAVTKYINSSKKNAFIDNVKYYADSARTEALDGNYQFPINTNEATMIYFSSIRPNLEKGGTTSSYGAPYTDANSFVVIVNEGTAEKPVYKYYIAARDDNFYGIGTITNNTATAGIINYEDLKSDNVVQINDGISLNLGSSKTDGSVLTTPLELTIGTNRKITRIYK